MNQVLLYKSTQLLKRTDTDLKFTYISNVGKMIIYRRDLLDKYVEYPLITMVIARNQVEFDTIVSRLTNYLMPYNNK